MKKIKILLIIGAMVLIGFAGLSQTITYRLNNYAIIPGTPDKVVFDVEAKSDFSTTYTTSFAYSISFSSTAFGTGLPVNPPTPLVLVNGITGYNFNTAPTSAGPGKWIAGFAARADLFPHSGAFNTAFLSNLTTEFQGIARYEMAIIGTGPLNVELHLPFMTGQSAYILTSGGTSSTFYSAVYKSPTITNVNLMLSEVGDPSDVTTNFVEIYNPNSTAVTFNYFPWFLNSGTSSVQLTGSVAGYGSYIVGYDNSNYSPDLVSTTIGTGGGTLYRLSFAGNYSAGTIKDVYDGTAKAFTGGHAVRHYNFISPNSVFAGSEWVVSTGQAIDMTPGSHRSTLTWDGVPSEDWRNKANWAENFIPDAGHNVSIPNAGETIPVIGFGDNAFAHNLEIGGSDAGLIIESDAVNGDGSLITYGTDITGITSVQRYLPADRYWYVSRPVNNATANVFLNMWLFTYTGGDWSPFIYDETTPLNLMQGYAVWTSSINSYNPPAPVLGTVTTSYDGVVNWGVMSKSLDYFEDQSPTAAGWGWNFVGNPYPSAVDWESAAWTKTNLQTDAYSVWDGATYGTYTAGSGGTNGTDQYIPAAQGFFVQTSAAGSLGVTNDVRAHAPMAFWKADENMLNRLSLTISNGTVNDETVIYFNENATTGLDYSYDAEKLLAPASPQAFTMMNQTRMALNTVNNTTETPMVTLGVNIPEAGEYTLTASNLESFDAATPIYLEDLLTGSKISLREMSSVSFSSQEGISERFKVHFAGFQGLGDQPETNISGIYAVDNNIYVDFNGVKGDIAIYNILGQETLRQAASNGLNVLSVPEGNAVYIVKVISDNTAVTKKVFVK